MILETLTTELKNYYDTEFRSGIHVSDLTLCPRKSILRKIHPTPTTMKELNFYTSGKAIHAAIQTLAQNQSKFEIEKKVEFGNILGHIDLYDSENNIPIECKSTRVKTVTEPKGFHIDQLKSYMAMSNATKGIILYQCLMNFDDKPFVEFEIETTSAENKKTLDNLLTKAKLYAQNLENKTAFMMEGVFNNSEMNWLCKDCPYKDQCQEYESREA